MTPNGSWAEENNVSGETDGWLGQRSNVDVDMEHVCLSLTTTQFANAASAYRPQLWRASRAPFFLSENLKHGSAGHVAVHN